VSEGYIGLVREEEDEGGEDDEEMYQIFAAMGNGFGYDGEAAVEGEVADDPYDIDEHGPLVRISIAERERGGGESVKCIIHNTAHTQHSLILMTFSWRYIGKKIIEVRCEQHSQGI